MTWYIIGMKIYDLKENTDAHSACIINLGCRVNHYESISIGERLEYHGIQYHIGDGAKEDCADIYIINSCAVTAESERKSRQMVRRCIKNHPDAIVAICGCASQLERERLSDITGLNLIWGNYNKSAVADRISAMLEEGDVPCPAEISADSFILGRILCDRSINRFDRVRAYVKIEDGCNGRCAYCVIPKVRGDVVLRDESEILDEIKGLAEKGCHEVVLTGIKTDAYGERLAPLIDKAANISGIERIRLGSLDPAFLRQDFIDSVRNIEKFMPHFHLSLQSGCSKTLAAMKRRYNAEMASDAIMRIRCSYPDSNLSADIICGFPGETDEDFEQTLEFCRKARLLHAHIFTYSRRPGTVADTYGNQISEEIKNRRSAALSSLQVGIKKEILDEMTGKTEYRVLLETCSDGVWHGHTESFAEADITDFDSSLSKGDIVTVKAFSNDGNSLKCRMIK